VVLSTSGLTRTGEYQDVNFDLKKGEILGFAGLIGAGRTEVMKSIFGVTRPDSGEITLRGERFQPRNPSQAVAQGIGFAPEDRKKEGLILLLSVKENIGITHLEELSSCGFLKKKKFEDLVEFYIRELSIRTPFKEQVMSNLSGGNQQKTVLAKWLATNPQILILDEPTCGIDVGAKQEIYRLINTLADSGISIIVVSSEMPEVIGLCDRIIVMHEGRITGEFSRSEVSQERIMHAASGDIVHAE
jgi:ABC-type sugar transport system ATPase subunit